MTPMRTLVCLTAVALGLAGCTLTPSAAPGELGSVIDTAPRLSDFSFADPPLAAAIEFDRWRTMSERARVEDAMLDVCLADKAACATDDLVRFRRLVDLAASLPAKQQLNLVQAYFNTVTWTDEDRDTWLPLYAVAAERSGDCEDVALAKYATLRRLGWTVDDLRVAVGWDHEEKDWHAWLIVRHEGAIRVLDSIKDVQGPGRFRASRVVYSISESGVWDHAPDYVPIDLTPKFERAARFAAVDMTGDPS